MYIYDSFLFYNELELLEIRLYELAPIVEEFILLEGTHTHQGKVKPLYFDENKSWFKDYNITHLIQPMRYVGGPTHDEIWQNEIDSRNAISDYFEKLPNTIAMLSDVDEIPLRETIESLDRLPVRIKNKTSYYYLNLVADKPVHCEYGTIIVPSEELVRVGGQKLRDCIYSDGMPSRSGGWHFSYIGSPAKIKDKLQSFTHSEYNTNYYTDTERIKSLIQSGEDLFDLGLKFHKVPIDERFPELVREHPDRFQDIII